MTRSCSVGFRVPQGIMGRREFGKLQVIVGRIRELCNYQSIMGGKGRPEAHGKEMELWVKQKTIGMMKS